LEVLDEAARPRVITGAFDEIFVGRTPVLMGVEPASLCWVLGQVADNREGQTWAAEFNRFPSLEHAITDAGNGLVKGLALTNEGRSRPLVHSLDVFHLLYEGNRAWRRTQSQVWKLNDQAEQLRKGMQRRQRQGQPSQGHARAFHAAERQATAALESAIEVETAWGHVQKCLELFTPTGQLNTCSAARAKLDQWLPRLKGAPWAKTVRLLQRPQSLTFLARVEQQLGALPLSEDLKQDALRFEGLRRQPQLLEGEDQAPRAARGWWLLASVRYHRDQEFQKAVSAVRGVLRGCWRASSLVEGINSVVRMQQARHRKLTPSLINLKRFYWNCRRFRTGRRRDHCPYEWLGISLPPGSWWALSKMDPDALKQQLSTQALAL
jgi:hypothetical protein